MASEVSSSLIPVLAVWLIGETSLHRIISPFLGKLEGNKSPEDLASVIGNLEVLVPYLGAELLQGCPQVEENFSSEPLPLSLEVTFGSSLLPFWNNFTSLPSPQQPWPALTTILPTISRLAAALELLPMGPTILRPGGSLIAALLSILGTEFGLSTFLPLFEAHVATGTLLPMLVAGMTQNSNPLSSAALPLIIRHLPSNSGGLNSSFQEAVSTLAGSSERTSLVGWIAQLAHGENLQQRLQATELVGLLLPGRSGNEVWTLLQILVADSEAEVVVASLAAVSSLLASPGLPWEEKEAVSLVLTKLLQDSRDSVVAAAISNIASLLPSWQGEGRDELLLVPLASVPLQWQAASPRAPALHAALLAALAIVPELVTTEAVLSGHVLPGLVVLLEAMRGEEGMEEAVLMVMAEVEGSRRRGAGRQRRESTQSANSGQSTGGEAEGKESVKTRVGKLLPKSSSMQLSPFWKK